jgi:hypothetical protein
MDYFSTFGGFKPQQDLDAAVKFALNALLLDERVGDLQELLNCELGGLEGEPGWVLERRSIPEKGERPENPPWPEGAVFRAYVHPGAYRLTHPEYYMTRERFETYVTACVSAYRARSAANGDTGKPDGLSRTQHK